MSSFALYKCLTWRPHLFCLFQYPWNSGILLKLNALLSATLNSIFLDNFYQEINYTRDSVGPLGLPYRTQKFVQSLGLRNF